MVSLLFVVPLIFFYHRSFENYGAAQQMIRFAVTSDLSYSKPFEILFITVVIV